MPFRSRAADSHRRGFTLVELLVVIAIIAILIMMLFPSTMAMRESARQTQCASHLMQVGLSFQEYLSSHSAFPSGTTGAQGPILSEPKGLHQSWTLSLLPYLDEMILYKQVDLSRSVYDPVHEDLWPLCPREFRCPSDTAAMSGTASSYAGVHHDQEAPINVDQKGILFLNSQVTREMIPDGLGYTLLVGEKLSFDGDLGWMSGTRATLRNGGHQLQTAPAPDQRTAPNNRFVGGFGSHHPTVCGFLFADGRVEFLGDDIELTVLQQLTNREDGSLIDLQELQ
ncbi:MAG: DUF1559 domain-containing protein [Planctomycetota bacterium]